MDMAGFEPASANTSELESDPLDRSGTYPGTRCGARTHGHTLKRRALYLLSYPGLKGPTGDRTRGSGFKVHGVTSTP